MPTPQPPPLDERFVREALHTCAALERAGMGDAGVRLVRALAEDSLRLRDELAVCEGRAYRCPTCRRLSYNEIDRVLRFCPVCDVDLESYRRAAPVVSPLLRNGEGEQG